MQSRMRGQSAAFAASSAPAEPPEVAEMVACGEEPPQLASAAAAPSTATARRPPMAAESYATSRSFCASASDCSFFSDWFSIWRMRSRVTLNVRPTSSSVRGCSPPSP